MLAVKTGVVVVVFVLCSLYTFNAPSHVGLMRLSSAPVIRYDYVLNKLFFISDVSNLLLSKYASSHIGCLNNQKRKVSEVKR